MSPSPVTQTQQTGTGPGETLAAVRALRPLISQNRHKAHVEARMAPDVVAACREAGVFTLFAPTEVGGRDVDFQEAVAVFEELGYSDPTIAWAAGNSSTISVNAVYLDSANRSVVFAGDAGPFGHSATTGGVAHVTEGGYRLTGRWPAVTGSLDAPWAWLPGVVHVDGRPRLVGELADARGFIVPAKEFILERTWDTASAMRGTASHAICLQDVFVPEGLARSLLHRGERQLESKSSRRPWGASFPVAGAAIAVGIARRAVDEAVVLIKAQSPRFQYEPFRDRGDIQQAAASGMAAVAAYNAGLQDMAGVVQSAATSGGPIPEGVRARMWASMFWTLDQTRTVVSDMVRISTSALYSGDNATELGLRDLHAVAASLEAFRPFQRVAGRVVLGMPPEDPLF